MLPAIDVDKIFLHEGQKREFAQALPRLRKLIRRLHPTLEGILLPLEVAEEELEEAKRSLFKEARDEK